MANTENMHTHTHTLTRLWRELWVCLPPSGMHSDMILHSSAHTKTMYTVPEFHMPGRMTSSCTADQLRHFIRNTCSPRARWRAASPSVRVTLLNTFPASSKCAPAVCFMIIFTECQAAARTHTPAGTHNREMEVTHTHTHTPMHAHTPQVSLLTKIFLFSC